jgi:hypothetical protein
MLEDHPLFRPALIGLLLAVGVGLTAFLLFALGKDLALWVFGEHTMATVVASWAEPVGDKSQEELSFRYYLQYEFATPDGKLVTSTKSVSVQEWVGVGAGAQGRSTVDFYDGSAHGPAAPVYREQEHLTEFNAGGVAEAGTLAVVYFPLHPAHNRLEESRFIPLLACLYVPFLALGGAALGAARHLLRSQRSEGRANRTKWTTWQVARE